MRVLCRVLEVREMELTVSLPGRLVASVPITNVSAPYSRLLSRLADDEDVDVKSLKEMFATGQTLACCIKEAADDGSYKVVASLNPTDVNGSVPVSALSKGMVSCRLMNGSDEISRLLKYLLIFG